MVGLMIILFHLKLDKFYSIGAMNQLKMIYYDLFFSSLTILYQKYFFFFNNFMIKIFLFFHIKMSYRFFNKQESKDRYHHCVG